MNREGEAFKKTTKDSSLDILTAFISIRNTEIRFVSPPAIVLTVNKCDIIGIHLRKGGFPVPDHTKVDALRNLC